MTPVLLLKNPLRDCRRRRRLEAAEQAGSGAPRLTSPPGALNCRLFSSGLDLVEQPSVP
jgi:hypothetical protein